MKRNRETNIPTTATTPSDAGIKDPPKRKKVYGGFEPRELSMDDRHAAVGCAVAIERLEGEGGNSKWILGIVKFYLPKFDKYFVHMFSVEEGFTEFLTLPKALKEANHWKLSGNLTSVDFSRLCKDRFWVGAQDVAKLHLLTESPVWFRSEKKSHPLNDEKDWAQCTECTYLIDTDEERIVCKYCGVSFHSDCLIAYEKKEGPEYSPDLLDKQAKRYVAALDKWRARKTSKNPSLVLEEAESPKTPEAKLEDCPKIQNFACSKCRDCRYCCRPLFESIIPSGPNLPSVEPWVVCKKCNAVAHGECVFPSVPKLHASVEYECDDCRECNSCGRVSYLEDRKDGSSFVSPLTDWALPSFEQCKACWAGIDRGEYCPVCMKAWTTEWGGNMIQCDTCGFWVHTECDSLDTDFRSLSASSVKYNCPICRDSTDVSRRGRVIDLLRTIDKIALFSEPVSADFLPTYLKVIKQPMDLQKMKQRNDLGYVSNSDFIQDFELIVANAKIFNMPNSAAYRLAEQFHKQGKLLIEKYLLVDRKGACKLEDGPAVVNRKKTYEGVLKKISTKPASIDSNLMELQGDLISPYRRKLSGGNRPLLDTPRGESAIPAMVSPPCGLIETNLMEIFGFTDGYFLTANTKPPICSWQYVPAKFHSILARPNTSEWTLEDRSQLSVELLSHARFALYDCCSICRAFGEAWNFVDCSECGEATHWYCAGLVANPNESIVKRGENPLVLTGTNTVYKCVGCRSTQGCVMCGHNFCGFQLDDVRQRICSSCALSQAFHFFRTPTCWGCETPINPNLASQYLQALPEAGDSEAGLLTNRTSPLVHCMVCGHTWHTRCLSEFSDIASTDILGVYVCGSCKPPSTAAAIYDETLNELGTHLRNFKSRAYHEIQVDFLVETLRSFGLSIGGETKFVNELLEMFSVSGSCLADCVVGAPPGGALTSQETEWIEWGLIHKEFLVGLGNVETKQRKNDPSSVLPNGAVSVKIKRMEDEDLLLAKRLFVFYQELNKKKISENTNDFSIAHLSPFPHVPATIFFGDGSELGANLLRHWLVGGQHYTGPGTNKVPHVDSPVPVWETRSCSLCLERGDQLVFGVLLPYATNKYVHAECLGWSLPRVLAVDFTQRVHWKYALPSVAAGPPGEPAADSNIVYSSEEISNLVESSLTRKCVVCHKNGASVHCQQCQGTWLHLGCALRSNDSDKGLLIDSRCRLLTCADCLAATGSRHYFVSQFKAALVALKSSQSAIQQLFAQRHLNRIEVENGQEQVVCSDFSNLIVREGSLAIIQPGSDLKDYDGGRNTQVLTGFVSSRLYWTVDYALTSEDDEFMKSVIGKSAANNRGDLPLLKKRRKTVYVNKISADFYSIEIMGGRVVAIGKSLEDVWAEFESMMPPMGTGRRTGAWFFGLESAFMKNHLRSLAMKSIRKHAGLNRDKWIHNPDLRAQVTEVLNIKELKPVRSWRRDIVPATNNKLRIDQLKSLGREPPHATRNNSDELLEILLEPALVIFEKTTSGRTTDKSGRTNTTTDSSNNTSKYKGRSMVADAELLAVKRSKIHNYGLFAKLGFTKSEMVVEYQGEILRQTIADEREKRAEREGNGDGGSCYMFKLDDDYVVDATVKGNCARFINHSCNPNCTCKMVEDEQHKKHIMIVAKRDIIVGEEITYDYQFAVESEKLACLCGAPNCLGRLN